MKLPEPPARYDVEYERTRNRIIESADVVNAKTDNKETYVDSNVTASRTLDATAATLAETRQVLGTLIQDLRNRGLLG